MGGCCGNTNNWFAAAQYNRCDYLKRNKMAFTQRFDDNGQEDNQFRFTGFAAIHYAAYFGHLEAVQLLIPYEFNLTTKEPAALIVATCNSVCEGVDAPADLSALHLSIIGNAAEVTSSLFEKRMQLIANETEKHVFKQPRNALFTVLGCQIMNGNSDQFDLIEKYHSCYLEQDAKIMFHQEVNPLLLAVYMGRKPYVELVLELSQSKLYGKFYRVFVENQNTCRWDFMAWQKIPEKLIAPREQIQECLRIIQRFNVHRREPIPEWMGGTHEHKTFSMSEFLNPPATAQEFDIEAMGDVAQYDRLCGDSGVHSFGSEPHRKDSGPARRSMNVVASRKSSSVHSSMDQNVHQSRSPRPSKSLRRSFDCDDENIVAASDEI